VYSEYNAVIELYKAAFGDATSKRVKELSGKVLAFTVSHDHDKVSIHGHFAVIADDPAGKLEFYRYPITLISLRTGDGGDRYKSYNFVRNVYDKFVPEHLRRIRDAAAALPKLSERTEMSFAASEMTLEENSQQDSQDAPQPGGGDAFQKPGLPASALQYEEMVKIRQQIDRLLQQMEQQRQDSKEEMEQQRQESKEQMEQQRQQMERQLTQQEEMILLLRNSQK